MPERLARARAVQQEQTHLDLVYRRLDALRERERDRLAAALRPVSGPPQQAVDRDALAAAHRTALVRYGSVEHDLCFGRLDLEGGASLHVGRIGLRRDPEAPSRDGAAAGATDGTGGTGGTGTDDDLLLTDWRAPAARPFYTATGVEPQGVRVRRTITTRRRRVTGVDEDLLARGEDDGGDRVDGAGAGAEDAVRVGDAALMEALSAPRTGRMRDIVRTIQAEQDAVIRSPLSGVLVVEGGPGTGKTAVALHRAAYLLFTHRELLERRGVLLVGPTGVFLRYVSHVLPSLAETGVLAATVAELFPGVVADLDEAAPVARLKGDAGFAAVLAAAVADRQEVPAEGIEVELDGEVLRLEPAVLARLRRAVRARGLLHNPARRLVVRAVARLLARRLAARIGHDPYGFDPLGEDDAPGTDVLLDADDIARMAEDLRADPQVARVADRLWPVLTPQRALADLWASPERLATAAPHLTAAQRALLRRDPPAAGPYRWSAADVPLLDELAELLGEVPAGADGAPGSRGSARLARRAELARAQEVLDVAQGSAPLDLEAGEGILQVGDLLDAAALADRHAVTDARTAAERAAGDRTWAFGHVVVDEAQEVPPMAWRLLARRCPARSMTVVGDRAQAGAPDVPGWADLLGPYVGDRWRHAVLSVGYRTPGEIMDVAAGVLRAVDPGLEPPRSVRRSGEPPRAHRVAPGELAARAAAVARAELERVELDGAGAGTVAVVVPPGPVGDAVAAAVAAGVPGGPGVPGAAARGDRGTAVAADPDLDARCVVLHPARARGLEFDGVVVVEPAAIVADSPGGLRDLYVAVTRATHRLAVVHARPLPPSLVVPEAPEAAVL